MAITCFRGVYRFLSNFYPTRVVYGDGWIYPTVEHAFQAAKTTDPTWQAHIRHATTPGDAKRLGRRAPLRPDWEADKQRVMYELLLQKFQHPSLRAQLVATGEEELVEGNGWGDTYWGVCRGVGENHLGKLLMQIRKEILDGQTI